MARDGTHWRCFVNKVTICHKWRCYLHASSMSNEFLRISLKALERLTWLVSTILKLHIFTQLSVSILVVITQFRMIIIVKQERIQVIFPKLFHLDDRKNSLYLLRWLLPLFILSKGRLVDRWRNPLILQILDCVSLQLLARGSREQIWRGSSEHLEISFPLLLQLQ